MAPRPSVPRRPSRALRLHVAAAASIGLALAGCGSDPYPGEPAGTLHVTVPSEIKGLDPIQADEETSSAVVVNVYDQLYEYEHLARPYRVKPCLARGMPEVSADGLTYTIRLREGVRFADDPCFVSSGGKGRAVRASDVVFCLKRLMDRKADARGAWILHGRVVGLDAFHAASASAPTDPARAAYGIAEGYPEVEGLRALDATTLEIRLVEPYPQIVWVLAMAYGSIYPPEAIGRYGADFQNHAVSSGPYVVEEYKPTQRIVLRRNPAYRDDDLYPSEEGMPGDRARGRLATAGRAMPLNDRVVVTVSKEPTPMWLSFLRGHLDRVAIPKDGFEGAVDATTRELLPALAARGLTLDKDPRLEVIYDCFNMNDPVVGKGERGRAIRRAMSLAFDYGWAAENLYNDRVTRAEGPILEEFAEFDPAFTNPWKPGKGETRPQALERARRILADAGMPGGRGIPEIEQDVQESTTDRQHFAASQRDFADIGIRLRPYTSTWSEMNSRITKGQAQMFGLSWGADYPEAQNFLQLFYGPNKAPGPNGSAYENPAFDDAYARASSMPPSPERTTIYRELQRLVVDDCVWIVKYRRVQYTLVQPWVHGFRYNDLSAKFYKHCAVDPERRATDLPSLNRKRLLPGVLLLGAFAALVVGTVVAGRLRPRGW